MINSNYLWLFFVVGIGLGVVFGELYENYPGVKWEQQKLLPNGFEMREYVPKVARHK